MQQWKENKTVTYLLDSNIVSYALKKNTTINNKLRELSFLGSEIFISCITYYEIKRGLVSINASKQLVDFHGFCNDYQILFLDLYIVNHKKNNDGNYTKKEMEKNNGD